LLAPGGDCWFPRRSSMGASQGRSPLAACGAPNSRGGPIVVSVVRTAAWGLGDEEDVWMVEVPKTATLADVKMQIAELYDLPVEAQRLCRTNEESDDGLQDTVRVDAFAGQRLYLFPAMEEGEDGEAEAALMGMEALLEAAQEAAEVNAAMEQSLQGVTWVLYFHRPEDAGGPAAGRKIQLQLDALSIAGDVQQMVEVELFGAVGSQPAFLVVDGILIPPEAPLYSVGVEDGKTITVAAEAPPPTDRRQLMAQLLGAGGGENVLDYSQ